MSNAITWPDVRAMTGDEPVEELAGLWVDTSRQPQTRIWVEWAGRDCWSVFDEGPVPLDGGVHRDGETELIEGGLVIWRGRARLDGPQRLRGYIDGPIDPAGMTWPIDDLVEIERSGRPCLSLTALNEYGERGTVIIDRATGWQLHVEVDSLARGFETVRINQGARPPELGRWAPLEPAPRPGTAYIADDGGDRRFGCHVEIDAGPAGVMDRGPRNVLIDEALDWARHRADRVSVRWGLRFFSAGGADLSLPPLPLDEIRALD